MKWWQHFGRKELKFLSIDGNIREIAHIDECPLIVVVEKEAQDPNSVTQFEVIYHFDCRGIITMELFECMKKMGIGQKHKLHTQHNGHLIINENEKLEPYHTHSHKQLHSHKLVIN